MALFPGDVIIKTAIELGLEDLRANPWIVEEIFSEFLENPLLAEKYGWKYVDQAKKWIANNKIHIFMAKRIDKEEFPCVTIAMGDSPEDKTLATLGDQTVEVKQYGPDDIKRPIPWMIKPFDIESFDSPTGLVKIPKTDKFKLLNEGMLLVNVETGEAATIIAIKPNYKVQIAADTELAPGKYAIAPRYCGYRARMEGITSQETYQIGCHASGDENSLLFLFAFVKYALLRYREGLLEHNNFQNSTLSCTDMFQNQNFESAANIYSRFITLTGQAEETWVKTPYRIIESTLLQDCEDQPGIKIISNHKTDPDSEEVENDLWVTTTGNDEEES